MRRRLKKVITLSLNAQLEDKFQVLKLQEFLLTNLQEKAEEKPILSTGHQTVVASTKESGSALVRVLRSKKQ